METVQQIDLTQTLIHFRMNTRVVVLWAEEMSVGNSTEENVILVNLVGLNTSAQPVIRLVMARMHAINTKKRKRTKSKKS